MLKDEKKKDIMMTVQSIQYLIRIPLLTVMIQRLKIKCCVYCCLRLFPDKFLMSFKSQLPNPHVVQRES